MEFNNWSGEKCLRTIRLGRAGNRVPWDRPPVLEAILMGHNTGTEADTSPDTGRGQKNIDGKDIQGTITEFITKDQTITEERIRRKRPDGIGRGPVGQKNIGGNQCTGPLSMSSSSWYKTKRRKSSRLGRIWGRVVKTATESVSFIVDSWVHVMELYDDNVTVMRMSDFKYVFSDNRYWKDRSLNTLLTDLLT